MKITSALVAAVAAAGSIGIIGAPIAAADDLTTTTLGNEARLTNGNVVQGWTISNLKASTDTIPYRVVGTLWEATATDKALEGSATPIVSNLNARTRSGESYRVLFGVATPQGVNPATLAQGEKTTGKVYFDVVGDSPDRVAYNSGGQDQLVWVQPPPPARGGGKPATSAPASGAPATPPAADSAVKPGPEGTAAPAVATAPGSTLPAGSQGTPLPAGAQGTPLPAGAQGTPLPAGAQGTPLPAGAQGTPLPEGTQGTPLPAGSQGTPVQGSTPAVPAVGAEGVPQPAAVQQPAPAAAGSQGTPLAGTPVLPTPVVVVPPSA